MKARRVSEVPSTGHCSPFACGKEYGIQGRLGLVLSRVGGRGSRGWEFEESRLQGWESPAVLRILCMWLNLESLNVPQPTCRDRILFAFVTLVT